jgi:cytidylate kinase
VTLDQPKLPATTRLLTVSATYGAGGSVIAPLLAKRLGLPFVDRLSHPHGPPADASERASAEELAEAPRSSFLESLALLSAEWNIPTQRDPEDLPGRVRQENDDALRRLLEGEGAVVLGRAAAAALGRRPGVFHVRLDGPVDRRAARGAAWEGVDVDTARRRLDETDATRSRYVRKLYRRDPADASLYHLVLDATVLSTHDCVAVIADAAQGSWTFDERAVDEHLSSGRARRDDPG